MIKGSFPNGKGNAESIKSKRIKGHIFPIRRLEYLFDFLAEEPDSIFVKENEDPTCDSANNTNVLDAFC